MTSLRKEVKSWPMVLGTAAVVFVVVMLFSMLRAAPRALPGENGWDGGVYESTFLKLQFLLPDGWEAWDEKELGRSSAGNAAGSEARRIQDTYLMWAGHPTDSAAVYIQASEVSGGRSTEEAGEELSAFYEGLEQVSVRRLDDQVVAGETYYVLRLDMAGEEEPIRQYLFVRMQDDFVVNISLAARPDLDWQRLMDRFVHWDAA